VAAFAGLVFPDQPAAPPHKTLFIKQPLQYFSLATTSQNSIFQPSFRSAIGASAFSDADWIDSLDDRRSKGGFAIFLGQI